MSDPIGMFTVDNGNSEINQTIILEQRSRESKKSAESEQYD